MSRPTQLPTPDNALPHNDKPVLAADARHEITGELFARQWDDDSLGRVLLGMGCFWGAEKHFWPLLEHGLVSTAAGYAGGYTEHPGYEQVCTGMTGHAEVVLLTYRPQQLGLDEILHEFWEGHNPTQGMRQGADQGTQYRSAIYVHSDDDMAIAERSLDKRQQMLAGAEITTELGQGHRFWYAEGYHQQYLLKNPTSSCNTGACALS